MKLIAKNKRAYFDYAIADSLIAGIVLTGAETKSVRSGLVSMKGSFARIRHNEVWLHNMRISPYPFSSNDSYDPLRHRKLLITKREISKLLAAEKNGDSIVPLAILAGRHIKIELGIGRGKKKHDKRQVIKQRDTERAIRRGKDS